MQTATTPNNGARFQLNRLSTDETQGHYQLVIYLPELTYEYHVTITLEDGAGELQAQPSTPDDAPPLEDWMLKYAQFLCKQVHRSAKKGTWTRRLRQWKTNEK